MIHAREKLNKISQEYHKNPTTLKRVQLISAKKELDDAYLSAEADYINGKINDISSFHISKGHHAAWTTIKEVPGKSSKQTIRVKGGSSEKRTENWLDHFKNLLGKKPNLPASVSLPKVKISDSLNIDTIEFIEVELSNN